MLSFFFCRFYLPIWNPLRRTYFIPKIQKKTLPPRAKYTNKTKRSITPFLHSFIYTHARARRETMWTNEKSAAVQNSFAARTSPVKRAPSAQLWSDRSSPLAEQPRLAGLPCKVGPVQTAHAFARYENTVDVSAENNSGADKKKKLLWDKRVTLLLSFVRLMSAEVDGKRGSYFTVYKSSPL